MAMLVRVDTTDGCIDVGSEGWVKEYVEEPPVQRARRDGWSRVGDDPDIYLARQTSARRIRGDSLIGGVVGEAGQDEKTRKHAKTTESGRQEWTLSTEQKPHHQ